MLGRTSHAALSRVLQWHTDGVRATGDSGASVGMVTLTREEIDSSNSGAPYLSPDQRAAVGPLPPFSRNFQSPAHGGPPHCPTKHSGRPLSDAVFIEKVEDLLSRSLRSIRPGLKPRIRPAASQSPSWADLTAGRIVLILSANTGSLRGGMGSRGRSGPYLFVKWDPSSRQTECCSVALSHRIPGQSRISSSRLRKRGGEICRL